jgi:protein ImuB
VHVSSIACVHAPNLALQAVLRGLGDAQERTGAFALAAGAGGRAQVLAVTTAAAGVRAGMTVGQALSVLPSLRVVTARQPDVDAAAAALADLGLGFAPRVESEVERVFFEAGDLGQLYPDLSAVAHAARTRAARLGLEVRVGIATSKGLARVACRTAEIAIVPPSPAAARAFLAPLPLAMLAPTPEIAAAFARWGLRTVGELARLRSEDVTLRLGATGARLARLARGQDDEPFLPQAPADAVEEGTDLDYAIDSLDPLAFVLRGLVDRALARLSWRGLACAGLTLRLSVEPRGFEVREVPLQSPTREPGILLQLVRLELSRRAPSAPVTGMTILVRPARVRAMQLDMLRPNGPAPDRLAATLARLSAMVGPDHVGTPRVADTWREEAMTIDAPNLEATPIHTEAKSSPGDAAALGIRRFRPPQEVEVLVNRDGPTAFRGKETAARVLIAAGPYRISGEWWTGSPLHREYWDVHASDGAVYRMHKERTSGQWFLDGYYD